MVYFSESYVGGFFGYGRTYGAVARFVCESVAAVEADWPTALAETAKWRAGRKERATVLHIDLQVPPDRVWETIAFVKEKLLVPPGSLAAELRGMVLRIAVYNEDAEHYLYLEVYREATTGPAA